MGRIHVGTSGFSYQDWVGHVYPVGTKKGDFLEHYARLFTALEVNYTTYRIPSAATMDALARKSGGRVRFTVKLTQLFTHDLTGSEAEARQFSDALGPLVDAGALGCLLAQFPYSFRPGRGAGDLLLRLKEWFRPHPLVVEVRNRSWVGPRLFDFLRANDLGFCCVDEPQLAGLLPRLEEVTSAAVAYVRFHGRNAAKWWQHDRPEERYDYLYSEEELSAWRPRLQRMSQKAADLYVFFNNHFEGKAVANAAMLERMLRNP